MDLAAYRWLKRKPYRDMTCVILRSKRSKSYARLFTVAQTLPVEVRPQLHGISDLDLKFIEDLTILENYRKKPHVNHNNSIVISLTLLSAMSSVVKLSELTIMVENPAPSNTTAG